MFGKEKKYEDIEKLILSKNIPILAEYKPFINEILNSDKMPTEIKMKFESLKQLFLVKNRMESETKSIKEKKPNVMARIIYISKQINEGSKEFSEEELENLRNELNDMNLKLETNSNALHELRKTLKEDNLSLLKEILKISYDNIVKDEDELEQVDEYIINFRRKLDELRLEKESLQNEIDKMYGFIHGIVGYKDVEKLDERYLK